MAKTRERSIFEVGVGLSAALLLLCIVFTNAQSFLPETQAVVSGLEEPMAVVPLSPDSVLVAQRGGRVLRVMPSSPTAPQTFALVSNVQTLGASGLLGLALDQKFHTNGYFYVFYTNALTGLDRVSRFTKSAGSTTPNSERILWEDTAPSQAARRGGRLAIGHDGYVFVAIGDHFSPSDAQSLVSNRGKLLRLMTDGRAPSTNPLVGSAAPHLDAIWAWGLRDPSSLTIDPRTGIPVVVDSASRDVLGAFDEVNLAARGVNLGWPVCDGVCSTAGVTDPVMAVPRAGGRTSITVATVAGTTAEGAALYLADGGRRVIQRLVVGPSGLVTGMADVATVDAGGGDVVGMVTAFDGAVYVVDSGLGADGAVSPGTVRTLRPTWYGRTPTLSPTFVPAQPASPVPGVVAAWSFDEGAGIVVADATGNGFAGVVNGATWAAAGRFGAALRFDGGPSQVAFPSASALSPTTSFTWSAWVRRGSIGRRMMLFEQSPVVGNWGVSFSALNRLAVSEFAGHEYSTSRTVTDDTQWHHIAVVKNGNYSSNVTMYLDGASTGTVSLGSTAASGVKQLGGDAWYGDGFIGEIDNVRLYSRALTAAEIGLDMSAAIPNADFYPPSVAISSPSAGQVLTGTVNVTATASDDVAVAGVRFLVDGAQLGGEVSSAPYGLTWDTRAVSSGAHVLSAIARDSSGRTTTSPAVTVSVAHAMPPPSVRITYPLDGATVDGPSRPATYSVAGDASEVARARFRVDGGAPVDELVLDGVVALPGLVTGLHTLTAELLRSDLSAVGLGHSVTFLVTSPDVTPPSVGLTSPAPGAVVAGMVLVAASASDGVGVAGVEFRLDGSPLGAEDTTAPYEVLWASTTGSAGAHVLTATARDAAGNTATSSIAVTVGTTPTSTNFSLRFNGNGTSDIDRVKVAVDDPATALPGPPADIGSTDFTIEFWMRATAAENPAGAISCGSNNNWILGHGVIDRDRFNQPRSFGISVAGGVLAFGVTGPAGDRLTICGSASVVDNVWHHVAAQRRRSDGQLQLFVDGVLSAQGDGPDGDVSYPDDGVPGDHCNGSCSWSDPYLVIGAEKHDAGGLYPSYRGWLDEIRLSSTLRYTTAFSRPLAPFSSDAATVALYSFDEGQGNVVADRSGAAGGPSSGVRRYGGSPAGPEWTLESPFENGDAVPPSEPTGLSVTGGNGTAFVAWTASTDHIGVTGYHLHRSSSAGFVPGPGTQRAVVSSTSYTDVGVAPGTYYYTVRAVDAAGNVSTAPVALLAVVTSMDTQSPSVSVTAPAAGASVAGTVQIVATASDNLAVAGVQFFVDGHAVGAEDTIAPYSVAWSSTGVANGSHQISASARDTSGLTAVSDAVMVTVANGAAVPAGLVASWAFDEGAGMTAMDGTGNGHTGVVNGATWTPSGRYGSALSFDGVNDYVLVPDSAALNVVQSFTWTAWVRRSAVGGWQALVQQGTGNGSWGLYFVPSNQLNVSEVGGGDFSAGVPLTDITSWHHVALVKSGDAGVNATFYVDGAVAGAVSIGSTAASGAKRLGGDAWYGADFFSGTMDNVRFYGRALSSAEIDRDMNAPAP